jgi:HEAT repeat protein
MGNRTLTASVLAAVLLLCQSLVALPLSVRSRAAAGEPGSRAASFPGDGQIDPSKAKSLDEQLKRLKSSKADERRQAALELGLVRAFSLEAQEKAAVAAGLAEALKDQDASVRSAVAQALHWYCVGAHADAKPAVPGLVEALRDPEREVRREASAALGGIGPSAKAALPALLKALKDPEPPVRKTTAWALGEIGSEDKLLAPPLVEALVDDAPEVRMEAAYALGTMGPKAEGTFAALKKATGDKGLEVRLAARLALWRIRGDEKQVRLALDDAAEQQNPFAALGNTAGFFMTVGPAAVGVLAANLQHPNAGVRQHVALTLRLIEPPAKQAVPALIQALQDPDARVREEVAGALRLIDPEAARKAGLK